MPSTRKKTIFWFEDYPEDFKEYCEALRERYDVIIGTGKDLVMQQREQPIDLAIVDLMIDPSTTDEAGEQTDNLAFKGINHRITGVEFLRCLRAGKYEEQGFPRDMPIIILTGLADTEAQKQAKQYAEEGGPYIFFEKPVRVGNLVAAVDELLNPQEDEE